MRPTTHRSHAVLTVNHAPTISIYIARCEHLPKGARRWNVRRRIATDADLILVLRMDETNQTICDYFLLPPDRIVDGRISLWEKARAKLDDRRSRNFERSDTSDLAGSFDQDVLAFFHPPIMNFVTVRLDGDGAAGPFPPSESAGPGKRSA